MEKKGNPTPLLVGMQVCAATMKNSMEVPQKTENRVVILFSNSTPGYISRENSNSKGYMHPLHS